MTVETRVSRQLENHRYHKSGAVQTVCVSTVLSYLGIGVDKYQSTSTNKNVYAYENVLRRFGYSVRSRQTECKVKKCRTSFTDCKRNLRKRGYSASDLFLVHVVQSKVAHLILINGLGETIIDTAPKYKWRVCKISIVEKVK